MDGLSFLGFDVEEQLEAAAVFNSYCEIIKMRENILRNFEENSYSITLKLSTDNDSGYISQNIESNSTPAVDETTAPVMVCSHDVYVNEDTLFEKPEVPKSTEDAGTAEDDYEEFGHLYYMNTDSYVEPSVESQTTTFSGFDSSMSCISNTPSFIIPVASPIIFQCDNSSQSPYLKTYTELTTRKQCMPTNSFTASTPAKKMKLELSPELFSDDEVFRPPEPERVSSNKLRLQNSCEKANVTQSEQVLVKRLQGSLSGLSPPVGATIAQMPVSEMLQRIKENECLLVNESSKETVINEKERQKSILMNCKKEDIEGKGFQELFSEYRYHGLYFNRSKVHEDLEHMYVNYAKRYIGAETQSSCTVFGVGYENSSPSKRKLKLRRMAKSPGKRLSHLARRRITFSKDSLHSATSTGSNSFIGSRTRQIMIDVRKNEILSRRISPFKKRTPVKMSNRSPRKRMRITPSSSAKKRSAMRLKMYNADANDSIASTSSVCSSRSSATKRTLFDNSPGKGESTHGLLRLFGADTSESKLLKRKTPRRALFRSPLKSSPSKAGSKRKLTPRRCLFSPESSQGDAFNRKRKRTDSDNDSIRQCKGSDNSNSSLTSTTTTNTQKSSSLLDTVAAHRKRKLIWAIACALRQHKVDVHHPQFKVNAAALAQLTRHFLPNLFVNGSRSEGSTTDSFLKITTKYAFAVTRGKTVKEIIREANALQPRSNRPSEYVGLNNVLTESANARNKENIVQEHSTEPEPDPLKNRRKENVECIRRVLDFDGTSGSSSKR